MNLPDLDNPERIAEFLQHFYGKLLKDEVLAPIFIDVAKIDIQTHLGHIQAYWEKLLLGKDDYKRHTMNIHRELHNKRNLSAADFERWLDFFSDTVREHYRGPQADRAVQVAGHIAANMTRAIADALCACGNPKSFNQCCGRFLNGSEEPKTPEQLMRSRYTAHALGGYGDYLVNSWWEAVSLGLTAASFATHTVNWKKLEVLHTAQTGDHGEVEFKAYFYPPESSTDLQVHHEHSTFERIKGRWYYMGVKAV